MYNFLVWQNKKNRAHTWTFSTVPEAAITHLQQHRYSRGSSTALLLIIITHSIQRWTATIIAFTASTNSNNYLQQQWHCICMGLTHTSAATQYLATKICALLGAPCGVTTVLGYDYMRKHLQEFATINPQNCSSLTYSIVSTVAELNYRLKQVHKTITTLKSQQQQHCASDEEIINLQLASQWAEQVTLMNNHHNYCNTYNYKRTRKQLSSPSEHGSGTIYDNGLDCCIDAKKARTIMMDPHHYCWQQHAVVAMQLQ